MGLNEKLNILLTIEVVNEKLKTNIKIKFAQSNKNAIKTRLLILILLYFNFFKSNFFFINCSQFQKLN